jgi:hypothetical protein
MLHNFAIILFMPALNLVSHCLYFSLWVHFILSKNKLNRKISIFHDFYIATSSSYSILLATQETSPLKHNFIHSFKDRLSYRLYFRIHK